MTNMATDFYTWLVSTALFPLHERIKGHDTTAVRRQMEKTQWWSAEELEQWRIKRMRDFLTRIGEHVPYYADLFGKHRFFPNELSRLGDIEALPLLTKADIRAAGDRMLAGNSSGVSRFNTGGSTGEPLIFYLGKERVSHDVAAKWRATRWWDVDIGDPETVVWGSPVELGAQDRLRSLRDGLFRTELLPAFEMSEKKLNEYIAAIRQRCPKMLFGYPSALSYIAKHARDRNIRLDDLGVKVAFVTSERLYDDQRALISEVFACPVANGYGGRDAGFIAHECPAGGMHITAEDIYVEVVDAAGKVLPHGEAGELVVTHMSTSDFPFVRYRTGDVGVLDDGLCPCGRGLPLLREIQGRTTDFIVAMDGTVMHGLALIYVLRDLPGIESFKVIQESRELVRVLIVRDASYQQQAEQKIQDGFRERLGEDVVVAVEYVDRIPGETSGKFRYIVSNIEDNDRQ